MLLFLLGLVFTPPVTGAVSGYLVGAAMAGRAKNAHDVMLAGANGGVAGGCLILALLALLWPPIILAFSFWWLAPLLWVVPILGGAAAGWLAIRIRGTGPRAKIEIRALVYGLLGLLAFVGTVPLGAGAARLTGVGGPLAAALVCLVTADHCFFMALRRWIWPLPLLFVPGAVIAQAILASLVAAMATASHPDVGGGGHGEATAGLGLLAMFVISVGLSTAVIRGILILKWHASSK